MFWHLVSFLLAVAMVVVIAGIMAIGLFFALLSVHPRNNNYRYPQPHGYFRPEDTL